MNCPLAKQTLYGLFTVQSNPTATSEDVAKATAGAVFCEYANRSMTIADLYAFIKKQTPYSMIYEQYEASLVENILTVCRVLSSDAAEALLIYSGYKDADYDAIFQRSSDAFYDAMLEINGEHPDEDYGDYYNGLDDPDRVDANFYRTCTITYECS